MPTDPISAGRKGGQSKSAAKIAAARRNGFQKRYDDAGELLPFASTQPEQTQQQPKESQQSSE